MTSLFLPYSHFPDGDIGFIAEAKAACVSSDGLLLGACGIIALAPLTLPNGDINNPPDLILEA